MRVSALQIVGFAFILLSCIVALNVLKEHSPRNTNEDLDITANTLPPPNTKSPPLSTISPSIQPIKCDPTAHHALLLFVPSRPGNAPDRAAIRETWGAHGRLCGVRIIFGMGAFDNALLQDAIAAENAVYGDLLQISHIIDSYYNQTQLILEFFRWGVANCGSVRFMGKADEDTWINIFGVLGYLKRPEADRAVTGWSVTNEKMRKVNRPEDDKKWFLTREEYANDTYPPFVMGYLYIFPASIIPDVLQASTQLKVHWIDDVFIAGQIPEILKLKFLHVEEYSFLYDDIRSQRCVGRNYYIIHGTNAEKKREIFYHNCIKHLYMRMPPKCLH